MGFNNVNEGDFRIEYATQKKKEGDQGFNAKIWRDCKLILLGHLSGIRLWIKYTDAMGANPTTLDYTVQYTFDAADNDTLCEITGLPNSKQLECSNTPCNSCSSGNCFWWQWCTRNPLPPELQQPPLSQQQQQQQCAPATNTPTGKDVVLTMDAAARGSSPIPVTPGCTTQ